MRARTTPFAFAFVLLGVLGVMPIPARNTSAHGAHPPARISVINVTPDGGSLNAATNQNGLIARFTVSSNTQDLVTVTVNAYCHDQVTGCTVAQSQVTFRFSTTVDVTFSSLSAGSGSIVLSAQGPTTQDQGSYNVTVVPPPGVAVTPDGSLSATRLAQHDQYSEIFTVTNTGGGSNTYTMACTGTSGVTCVGAPTPSSVPLAAGAWATVTANYSVGAPGMGRLKVTATGTVGQVVVDSGTFLVPIVLRAVAVRPELSERQHFAFTSGSQRFFVKNLKPDSAIFNLSALCSGTTTNCDVTPTTLSLTPGESKVATLTYIVGDSGTAGSGMVKAIDAAASSLRDSSSVTLRSVAPLFPLVSIVDVNPGTTVERDQCLTIAAGSAAAFECGDLRIVHALPAIRTLNKARVPTLLYNSATADPYPIVAASVTLGSMSPWPDSVEAVLRVGGVPQDSGRWAGTDWTAGTTRRIALRAALVSDTTASGDTTKVIDYTLEVATISLAPPGSRRGTTVAGRLIMVNRRRSSFGAGWWLAGLERLTVLSDSSRLWVGGDGSARVYAPAGANTWVAPRVDRPDTLTRVGQRYVHRLPGGIAVLFDAVGRHDTTVNRLGHKTSFAYTSGRLTSITLPSQGGGQTYMFAYDGNNLLTTVTAGARVTTVRVIAQRVDTIRDPDNSTVRFAYENASSRRIAARTDRRGTVTSYSYDAAKKLWRSHIALPGDSIRIGFRAADVQGLLTAAPKTATDTANVYTSFVGARQFTRGADSIGQETKFWLDRLGAPRRIVNAVGHQTLVKREDGEWLALATELVAANGFTTRAGYDGRGNLLRSTAVNPLGTGQGDAITRYHWDSRWDFADSIVTPTLVVTTLAYDTLNGNRLWQQIGSNVARRLTFAYYSSGNEAGLLRASLLPDVPGAGTARDSVVYDATLVNLAATRTPRGFWTSYYKDPLGRDTLIVTPIDSTDKARGGAAADTSIRLRQRTVYTVMDRDSITESIAPNRVQLVRVDKRYDLEGNLLSLARSSTPDSAVIGTITTQWRYDSAGRPVAEVAPDGQVDSTKFDPAGNATVVVTRRKHPMSGAHLSITTRYDALNRVIVRIVPEVAYSRDSVGIAQFPSRTPLNRGYPYYPNNAQGGYTAFADTATFAYNILGKDSTAYNRDALVRRWYYPNGMLQAETLHVRTLADVGPFGGSFAKHVYGLTYRYDLDGRRTVLKYPAQLAPVNQDSARFTYDAQGSLYQIWDLLGNNFVYHYNLRGEMDTLSYASTPGAVFEARTYDADGALAQDVVSGSRRQTVLRYDARQKVIFSANTFGARDTLWAAYSGLGQLLNSRLRAWGVNNKSETVGTESIDTLRHDALGNLTATRFVRGESQNGGQYTTTTASSRTNLYQPGTGRLARVLDQAKSNRDTLVYDSSGSTTGTWQVLAGQVGLENRLSYYAADGAVRAADYRRADGSPTGTGPNRFVFEEYRYDAYGRRVWVRARRDCDGILNQTNDLDRDECRLDQVRRTVWDGFQELGEIQQPGGDADTASQGGAVENDTTPLHRPGATQRGLDENPFFGRVLYTYGAVLDQPLSLTRVGYADSGGGAAVIGPQPWIVWAPFSILPLWNHLGEVDRSLVGAGAAYCTTVNGIQRCVLGAWPFAWSALHGVPEFIPYFWHGTVTEGKRDKAQTLYRRYRVYDPITGRFTQEDPIGLAGGLNLYGFAAGDPVTFSDPFGLCPWAGTERDRNLSDCPTDKNGEDIRTVAFRILMTDEGPEGNETVNYVVQHKVDVGLESGTFNCAGQTSHGCSQGTKLRLDQSDGAVGVATLAVHEVTHMMGHRGGRGEGTAWVRALNFYDRLPDEYKTVGRYNRESANRARDPAGFFNWACTGSETTPCPP